MSTVVRYSVSSKKGDSAQRVVQDLDKAPDLNPQANYREADIYVKPRVPDLPKPLAGNMLLSLADGLKEVQPELNKYLERSQKAQIEEDMAKGQASFTQTPEEIKEKLKANQMAFNELVDQGVIPQDANPHFLKGYRRAFLQNKAMAAMQMADQGYTENGELKSSLDPKAYGKWSDELKSKILDDPTFKDMDPVEVKENFLDPLDKHLYNLGQRHSTERSEEFIKQRGELLGREIYNRLSQVYDRLDGSDPLKGEERRATHASIIQEVMEQSRREGMLGSQINDKVLRTVAATALYYRDKTILDALDDVLTDPKNSGSSLGRTSPAMLIKNETRKQIDEAIEHDRRIKDAEVERVFYEKGMGMVTKNYMMDDSRFLTLAAKEMGVEKLKPAWASSILSLKHALAAGNDAARERDPRLALKKAELYRELNRTGDWKLLEHAANTGLLRGQDIVTYGQVATQAQNNLRNGFQEYLNQAGERAAKMAAIQEAGGGDTAAARLKAFEAEQAVQARMRQLAEEETRKKEGKPLSHDDMILIRDKALGEAKTKYAPGDMGRDETFKKEAAEVPSISFSMAMSRPPEEINPRAVKLGDAASFMADVTHAEETYHRYGEVRGAIAMAAARFGMDPFEYIQTQAALHGLPWVHPDQQRLIYQKQGAAPALTGTKSGGKGGDRSKDFQKLNKAMGLEGIQGKLAPGQAAPVEDPGPSLGTLAGQTVDKAVDIFLHSHEVPKANPNE